MATPPGLAATMALVSAVPLVLLGVALLSLRPRRAENVYFAGFSVLWGLQVATANASRLTADLSLHDVLFRTTLALLLPTALFLAYFAALHPYRSFVARTGARVAMLALLALPGLAIFLVFPREVVGGTLLVGGEAASIYGDGVVPFFFLPFYGAFYYALWRQFQAARADEGVGGDRARMVFLALAMFVAWVSTRNFLVWGLQPAPPFQPPTLALGLKLLFGAGVAIVAGMATAVLTRPGLKGVDLTMAAALVVPPVIAAGEVSLLPGVETGGVWRILAVALVVYAIARYQLFDLDVRLKRAASRALPLGVGARLSRAVLPAATENADYLYHRKLEVYRAALERSLGDASGGSEELRALRRQLGISDREHSVLEYVVRKGLGTRVMPPEAPPRVEPGARVRGRYRVERLLGEGAHGRAYLAFDEKEERDVVIKAVGTSVLGGKAARLLLREARVAGSLQHPNVIRVMEASETPAEVVLVMEYADGGSLFGLLRRRRKLPAPEASALLDQVLAGLQAAHAKGVVHRDIKPENILLTRDGTAKLADFGVARSADEATGMTQGAVGTLLYMSPEQVRGVPADATSDLYAAAVVFHQALTGRFYLRIAGKDDFQVRQLILEGEPVLALKGGPAWVESFLRKALAKEPEKRFASADEMRATLRRAAPALAAARPG